MRRLNLSLFRASAACLIFTVACAPMSPRPALEGGRVVVQPAEHRPLLSFSRSSADKPVTLSADGWADRPPTLSAAIAGRNLVFLQGPGGVAARDVDSGEVVFRLFTRISPEVRPVVSGARVFIPAWTETPGEDSEWIGFDALTGTRSLELRADLGMPLVANDDVLVTFDQKDLVGYAAEDGKVRWRANLEVAPPLLLAGERLYARVDGTKLGVFTASSGALSFKIDLGGTDAFQGFGSARPQLDAAPGLVAWVQDGALRVANPSTGKSSFSHDGVETFALGPTVIVVARGADVTGLDPVTGTSRWKATVAGDVTSLAVDSDTAVVRVGADAMTVLDAKTGKKRYDTSL